MAHLIALLALALVTLLPPAPLPAAAPDRWVAPLDGPLDVRRGFAPPATRWGAGHRGVDLAAPAGSVVLAAGAGTVAYAGALARRGVLAVRHGALRTTYEPVTPLVAVGDVVLAGEPVAYLDDGHAGVSAPDALLHWGLLRGDTYLDPLLLLRRGPSRLVPVPPPAASPLLDAVLSPAAAPPPPDPPPNTVPIAVATGAPATLGAALLVALRRRHATRSRDSP